MEKINDLRKDLQTERFEFEVLKKVPCTDHENKLCDQLLKNGGTLPEGVYAYEDYGYYTVAYSNLTEEELKEYLTYKQLRYLRTIKNCAVFFTTLTVIGLIVSLLFVFVAI